jgi:hypothetical protein
MVALLLVLTTILACMYLVDYSVDVFYMYFFIQRIKIILEVLYYILYIIVI